MKRFLATTSDERTWRSDRPILFLGEWCRRYDRRAAWEHLDAEVVPYHWDDRRQLDVDYQRLQSVYEQLLCLMSASLNQHHGTAHSVRYWRILLGPWLFMFIHTIFDRWRMVERASDLYEIDETLIRDVSSASVIPSGLAGALMQGVAWNHYVFGRVIKSKGTIPWQRLPVPLEGQATPASRRPWTIRHTARTAARDATSALLGLFTKSDEAMIIRTYLPRVEEIKLQLALGQVPKMWTPPPTEAVPPDMAQRGRVRIESDGADPFVQFVSSLIPEQIPIAYLEGYEGLKRAAGRLAWPSRPRVIFTANSDLVCEVFQEWAAAKVEAGHPLVLGQHGGFVGVAKRHPVEDHQLRTCDRFLSWGWRDEQARVVPAMAFTNVGKRTATWNPSGNLLLVTAAMRLFAYRCFSQPVGPNQSARFVEEQLRFAKSLGESVRATLTLRIDAADDRKMHTFYTERWGEAFPGVTIDPSVTPIEQPIRQCRLFVYTYNSTGFLETLGRDIPTVMFWNPSYYELRPSARPFFDLLTRARILHETPESAAQHVVDVWDDVGGWWKQPALQQARRSFCEQYARMPSKPLRVLKEALLTAPVRS